MDNTRGTYSYSSCCGVGSRLNRVNTNPKLFTELQASLTEKFAETTVHRRAPCIERGDLRTDDMADDKTQVAIGEK